VDHCHGQAPSGRLQTEPLRCAPRRLKSIPRRYFGRFCIALLRRNDRGVGWRGVVPRGERVRIDAERIDKTHLGAGQARIELRCGPVGVGELGGIVGDGRLGNAGEDAQARPQQQSHGFRPSNDGEQRHEGERALAGAHPPEGAARGLLRTGRGVLLAGGTGPLRRTTRCRMRLHRSPSPCCCGTPALP
ncbi:MAG: hypothetical protein ACK55I_03020, partial [bacterium]